MLLRRRIVNEVGLSLSQGGQGLVAIILIHLGIWTAQGACALATALEPPSLGVGESPPS